MDRKGSRKDDRVSIGKPFLCGCMFSFQETGRRREALIHKVETNPRFFQKNNGFKRSFRFICAGI